MDWWLVFVVAVLGAAVLAAAAATDRRSRMLRRDAESGPPDRTIPGLAPGLPTPDYVTDPTTPPPDAPDRSLSDADRAALKRRVLAEDAFRVGWADRLFVTDAASGWAVLRAPVVLTADGVGSVRELLPAVEKARAAGTGLVVAALEVDPSVVATLTANAVQRRLECLAIVPADLAGLKAIAAATGATVVRREDLQSGFLPVDRLGRCDTIVASSDATWVLGFSQADSDADKALRP